MGKKIVGSRTDPDFVQDMAWYFAAMNPAEARRMASAVKACVDEKKAAGWSREAFTAYGMVKEVLGERYLLTPQEIARVTGVVSDRAFAKAVSEAGDRDLREFAETYAVRLRRTDMACVAAADAEERMAQDRKRCQIHEFRRS